MDAELEKLLKEKLEIIEKLILNHDEQISLLQDQIKILLKIINSKK